jgi:poly(beta-D-mannuronate) lyase
VEQDIIIYPLPVSYILTIENHENLSKEISVFDLNGKKIVDKIVDSEGEIDVSQLNSGVYFLKYINGSLAKTIKFIKI